jgi:hypothetical protein
MLTLIDGPCQGTYLVRRAPVFLRAVLGQSGKTDVLDLVEDTPGDTEKVFIYKLDGPSGTVHVHGKGFSGWYALGSYRFLPEVDGGALRDNAAWQKWATEQLCTPGTLLE